MPFPLEKRLPTPRLENDNLAALAVTDCVELRSALMVGCRIVELAGEHASIEVLQLLHLGDKLLAREITPDLLEHMNNGNRAARSVERKVRKLFARR